VLKCWHFEREATQIRGKFSRFAPVWSFESDTHALGCKEFSVITGRQGIERDAKVSEFIDAGA